MKKFNLILLSIFCIACQNQKYTETTYVESKHIHIPNSNIDIITRQEIFEKLYEIYQIKKEAIEEQIKASLFSTHQEDAYMHIDSIINKYNIKINLKEPTAPFIPIENKYIHWSGNQNSSISIIEIVNPECDLCQIATKRTEKLLTSIKDKVKIGYVLFSNENTLSIQALLYASKKNKFLELFDEFISLPIPIDTTTILNQMNKNGLDINDFKNSIPILQVNCLNQSIYIRKLGISKTPTILVNNRLIYNPLDTIYIKKKIFSSNK